MVAAVAGIFIMPFVSIKYETGHGDHTGYVTAVEQEGVIFKTERAYIKSNLESSQEDVYCVVDRGVYDQLRQAQLDKRNVTIEHVSWFNPAVYDCKGESAIIISVR